MKHSDLDSTKSSSQTQLEIVALTPFERPDARLALAAARAGAIAILDLGRDPVAARSALDRMQREAPRAFGVRVPEGVTFAPNELPSRAEIVVLTPGGDLAAFRPRVVFVQITSVGEARAALAAGADGLVVKGNEAGGRVGGETSFVLLQRVTRLSDKPCWVQGGIGLHTAAACKVGGAAGVVLDAQLALVRESTLHESIKHAIGRMDGSETVVVADHRLYTRPDLAVARLAASTGLGEVLAKLGAIDLERSYVPAGQDAAFARSFAERYPTASGVIHAIRSSITEHTRDATRLAPIAPDSPLAREHGIRYPIAQGPMTRVSDRAAFADAVSRGGGLPFLALALLRGDEVRPLLEETRAKLGDRAWGVGILGFVPEELREEQLEVVRAVVPPAAIIAGGRPSQARPLESQGTKTYLHVPSPGLLDLFLGDGARRFVFEGRECGGHVGPRSSFALWETQIERLLAFGSLEEVRVLFAGGVHDARSAAMVAAMSAPLAARGAKIGVLMGTAYLFTHEAVSSGAIMPGFQRAAIECEDTVLLETGPGHSTRCTDSEYVRVFQATKRELEQQGKSSEDIWAELERLNLGRLRIAAKGKKRDNDGLVSVDDATQASEGMFMIGQVAALRDATLSIADLHREVSEGATNEMAARSDTEPPPPEPTPADVAIVGMACMFPGAPDTKTFWANVLANKSAITEVPKARWDIARYYDPASGDGSKTPSKWGGFLPPIDFDPLAYGIPPRSMIAIEPVQLLSLEVAKRALDDAGYGDKSFDRERASVVFGAEAGTDLSAAYGFRALWPQLAGELPAELDQHLPTLTEDSFPGVLANVISGRIANRLDLGGVNYTVDAACASSLAAVEVAVKELTTGTSDMVLCGGADLHNSINDYLLFASVHALSPTGACKTFDADADGIVLGEGVGCVVLKRLADAEKDGDRIYAVIKGVAGGSDGRSLGLTAPRKEGQMRAVDRAYQRAGVVPAEVGLVEAHGTGTIVGDRTELATLDEVWKKSGARPGATVLGSVKSQIGHTKCAAGLAGIIKASLALHHQVLPPTLHIKRFNPAYDPRSSPFSFIDSPRPWPSEDRKASVSAFGFGGTNFHVVLAGYDATPATGHQQWPAELFVFRAKDRDGAVRRMERLEALADDASFSLADLARAVGSKKRRADGVIQAAVVATSREDLKEKLRRAKGFTPDPRGVFLKREGFAPGKLAFLFSGQGSQRLGMLGDLFVAFPRLQRFLGLAPHIAAKIFTPMVLGDEAKAAQIAALTDTRVAQPALGMVELALAELLRSLGLKPDMVAGHSYGELAALSFAGAIAERDLVALSADRAASLLEAGGADPGTMAAIAATPEVVAPLLAGLDRVVIANHNAPDQTVISGPTAGVKEALARCEAARVAARSIPVACAFHSPVVARAKELFATKLAKATITPPSVPVYSNATAAPHDREPDAIRAMLADHVAQPVRFVDEIRAMIDAGARTFVEVGPGRVLTGLVKKIAGAQPHLAVGCDQEGAGIKALLVALAELATAGVALDLDPLFEGRTTVTADLEELTVKTVAATRWIVDGHSARPANGDVPKGALKVAFEPVVDLTAATQAMAVPVSGDREGAVLEYLRTTRAIIEAQREVMLSLLGDQTPLDVRAAYSVPPAMPSFSPPAPRASRPDAALGSRASAPPPSIRAAAPSVHPPPTSIAPAAKLPRESAAWIQEMQAAAPAPQRSLKEALLATVSERTGYPIDMLDLDLNLEAELSIDSIKRIEILGQLGKELGFFQTTGEKRDKMVEQLATLKTLRAMLEWLEKKQADANAPASQPGTNGVGSPEKSAQRAAPQNVTFAEGATAENGARAAMFVRRHAITVTAAPLVNGTTPQPALLAGKRISIVPDALGISDGLEAWLRDHGAIVTRLEDGQAIESLDVLVDLESVNGARDVRTIADAPKRVFDRSRAAIGAGATMILCVVANGGPVAREGDAPRPGLAGMMKTVARELPDVRTRVVAVDPRDAPAVVAGRIGIEIASSDARHEVAWIDGERKAIGTSSAVRLVADGGRSRVKLSRESVVLVTGGARGIGALAALGLAKRFQCRVEIVGRSPLPEGDEDRDLATAKDLPAIRRVLIGRGTLKEPAKIEAEASRIVAARDVRATMKGLAEREAPASYHALDVRDAQAFGALIDSIYAKHGRIDGIVHAAGVIEDKRIADKTRASFDRVFDTKVASALTIAQRIRPDVGFVAFFASVSGAFGNVGQIDYSSANDTLDKIAWWMQSRVQGRVVSIDWGPWAGAGMVSAELEREYARRGVGLIEPSMGVDAFLDEVLSASADPQVVLANASIEALAHAEPQPSENGPETSPSAHLRDA